MWNDICRYSILSNNPYIGIQASSCFFWIGSCSKIFFDVSLSFLAASKMSSFVNWTEVVSRMLTGGSLTSASSKYAANVKANPSSLTWIEKKIKNFRSFKALHLICQPAINSYFWYVTYRINNLLHDLFYLLPIIVAVVRTKLCRHLKMLDGRDSISKELKAMNVTKCILNMLTIFMQGVKHRRALVHDINCIFGCSRQ